MATAVAALVGVAMGCCLKDLLFMQQMTTIPRPDGEGAACRRENGSVRCVSYKVLLSSFATRHWGIYVMVDILASDYTKRCRGRDAGLGQGSIRGGTLVDQEHTFETID
jgi:hypothetical protein